MQASSPGCHLPVGVAEPVTEIMAHIDGVDLGDDGLHPMLANAAAALIPSTIETESADRVPT